MSLENDVNKLISTSVLNEGNFMQLCRKNTSFVHRSFVNNFLLNKVNLGSDHEMLSSDFFKKMTKNAGNRLVYEDYYISETSTF